MTATSTAPESRASSNFTAFAAPGLAPDNSDRLNTPGISGGAPSLDSDLGSHFATKITSDFRGGPARVQDLLDPALNLHIRSAGDYIVVETSPADNSLGWSSFLTVWNRNSQSLALEKCFSFSFEFGVGGKAFDQESNTLAVLSDDRVYLFTADPATGGRTFRPFGFFRLAELGITSRPVDVQFESPGVLSLSQSHEEAPTRVALAI